MASNYENVSGDWVPVKTPVTLKQAIRNALLDALAFTNGQQHKAAECLGISERVLGYQMNKFGISTARNGKYVGGGKKRFHLPEI